MVYILQIKYCDFPFEPVFFLITHGFLVDLLNYRITGEKKQLLESVGP